MAHIYIHVGPHKCGTTAFQEMIFQNRETLNKHGIYIPISGVRNGAIAHHNLVWQMCDDSYKDTGISGWPEFFKEILNKEKVLISSEEFSSFPQHYNDIVDRIISEGHTVSTIFVFRHQIEIINSAYTQRIKTNNISKSFDQYFPDAIKENRYRYDHFYKNFLNEDANPIILLFDKRKLIDKIFNALNLDEKIINSKVEKSKSNISPLAHEIELLRLHSKILREYGLNFNKSLELLNRLRINSPFLKSFWGFDDNHFEIAWKKFTPHNVNFFNMANIDPSQLKLSNRTKSVVNTENLTDMQLRVFNDLSNKFLDLIKQQSKSKIEISEKDTLNSTRNVATDLQNGNVNTNIVHPITTTNHNIELYASAGDTAKCMQAILSYEKNRRTFIRDTLNILLYKLKNYSFALDIIIECGEKEIFDQIPKPKLSELFELTKNDDRWIKIFLYINNIEPHVTLAKIYRRYINPKAQSIKTSRSETLIGSNSNKESYTNINSKRNTDIRILEFDDVQLVGYNFGFSLFDEYGNALNADAVYTNNFSHNLINDSCAKKEELDQLVFIGDRFKPNNYCHFVVDHLPRLMHLTRKYKDWNCAAFGFENSSFQKQYLDLVNLNSKLLNLEPGVIYKIKKLRLLNTSTRAFIHCFQGGCLEYADPVVKISEQISNSVKSKGPRVYLTRSRSLGRVAVNDGQIQSYLKSNGFSIVDMGDYMLDEQISIMKNADAVIGIHGAALTNTLYCKPGTKVIEIFPPNYGTNAFRTISEMLGHQYIPLVGAAVENSTMEGVNTRENLFLEIEQLNEVLLTAGLILKSAV